MQVLLTPAGCAHASKGLRCWLTLKVEMLFCVQPRFSWFRQVYPKGADFNCRFL